MILNKRRAKRAAKKITDKALRSLVAEYDRLNDEISKLGYIDLPEPIFVGYVRTFRLRDDYTRRKDSKYWEDLLELVNTKDYCKSKTFTNYNKRERKREKQKLYTRTFYNTKDFENRVPSKFRHLFVPTFKRSIYRKNCPGWYEYNLINPYYFTYTISKNYATKRRAFDGELEQALGEIEHKIDSSGLWPAIYKLKGWCSKSDWEDNRSKKLDRLSNSEMYDS